MGTDADTTVGRDGVGGTQALHRALALVRAVGEADPRGLSAGSAAEETGLTRSTTSRLLRALAAEGFLDHDPSNGRWYLGPELYLLGSRAARRYDIADLAHPHVRRLAQETGESAFLSALRGTETVCLLREEGSFPLRSFVLSEGVRFPLGVASAGMVFAALLDDADLHDYLRGDPLAAQWGPQHSAEEVRRHVAITRENGYALNPGLVLEGSWGMGAVVFDRTGAPAWALSLTGVESRFKPARQPELGARLLEEAHALTQALRTTPRR